MAIRTAFGIDPINIYYIDHPSKASKHRTKTKHALLNEEQMLAKASYFLTNETVSFL